GMPPLSAVGLVSPLEAKLSCGRAEAEPTYDIGRPLCELAVNHLTEVGYLLLRQPPWTPELEVPLLHQDKARLSREPRILHHVGTSRGAGQAPGCSRTAGATFRMLSFVYYVGRCRMSTDMPDSLAVNPRINTEDLVDAQGVADLLGLAQR